MLGNRRGYIVGEVPTEVFRTDQIKGFDTAWLAEYKFENSVGDCCNVPFTSFIGFRLASSSGSYCTAFTFHIFLTQELSVKWSPQDGFYAFALMTDTNEIRLTYSRHSRLQTAWNQLTRLSQIFFKLPLNSCWLISYFLTSDQPLDV